MSRILVVDDYIGMRKLYETVLGDAGHHVHAVDKAEAGLRTYLDARFAGAPYQLLLTDGKMRGEMDGLELAAAVRQFGDTPIILISGNQDILRKARTRPHFSAVFEKPVSMADLERGVEQALRAQDSRP